jgi:hypothetical protein
MESVDPRQEPHSESGTKWPIYVLIVILAAATVVTAGYLYHEKQQNQELAVTNQTMGASLIQLRNELQAVRDQLNTPPPPPPARVSVVEPKQAKATKARPAKSVRSTPRPTKDVPSFKQIQGQLSDQQKALASAREDLDKTREDLGRTRDDLQGNIDSTRGELSGSIARTHDEVVALQKRGERNYYEFQLTKSKQFERVGPLRLSLRKADTKHKRFDVTMMVDDNELQKKNISLFETVSLSLADRPQPLEVVVNQITKDHIRGYISEPKYKKSELAADTRPAQ